MERRQVGRSDLEVSAIGLGGNNFGARMDEAQVRATVHCALDEGITFIDTAEAYSNGASEELLGAALGARRDEAVIATKFGLSAPTGDAPGSRRNVVRACDASLRRLRTDHIDLYYLHRPDPTTPIEETLDALTDLVREGKVRHVAASNLAGWQVADADHLARERGLEPFVADQVEWSLLARHVEAEVVPACRHFGVGVVAFFPLASGLLTGKYRRDEDPPAGTRLAGGSRFARVLTDTNFDKVERLTAVAEASGRSILEMALGWLLTQPGVASVLAGATSPDQVQANAAATTWRLSTDELEAVEAALRPPPEPGA